MPPFVFLHIPKCAGSTVHHVLCQNFHSTEISDIQTKLSKVEKNKKLISGHYYFNQIKDYFPNSKIICFVRNPVDRIFSQINFNRTLQNKDYHIKYCCNHSLDDILKNNHRLVKKYVTDNLLARSIVGNKFFSNWTGDFNKDDKYIIKTAIENINKIEFIGLFENLENEILKMCNKFGFSKPNELPKKNFLNKIIKEDIDTETIELLKHRTRLDKPIYDYIVNKTKTKSIHY